MNGTMKAKVLKMPRWKDPRQAIRERLSGMHDAGGKPRTIYWLGQELKRRKIMHEQTLYSYMRGTKDTKGETLFKILNFLGVTLTDE